MLYIFTETEDVTECDLAGLWPLLSEQRVKRVEKYRYFKDRKLSVLAYVLLRFALIEEYGINEMIEFEFGPYGKPFIKGFPELQFNLSHAAGGVACALAKSPVGVDIADVDERNLDCITSAMHPLEQDVIKRSKDKARTFARFWSMKESFLKYVGTGIDKSISEIDFSGFNRDSFDYKSCKMHVINGEKTVVSVFCSEKLSVKSICKIDLFDFLIGELKNGKFTFA